MAKIDTLNTTPRIEIVRIRKGSKCHYFKGTEAKKVLQWMVEENIKLKQLINSLK